MADFHDDESLKQRSLEIFDLQEQKAARRVDRMFLYLLLLEWLFAIGCSLVLSPFSWEADQSSVHPHVLLAIFLGGSLTLYPAYLIWRNPGRKLNSYVVTVTQMLMSTLLIHLTGGRVETHFHIFGSLAILAAYRNWRLIVLASAITAADHVFRGLYFPASIYGLTFASSWRAMEHIGWVAFEDVFLLVNIRSILGLSHNIAVQQADLEFALSLEENKRIRESLRSEKLLHLMMNSIPSMVGYLGIDNKYQFMNQSYQQVFGNATQEMQEGDIARVLGAESATFVLEQRARAFRGNNVHFELQFNLAGGELKVLDAHYIPDIDANGKVQGLIVLCTDLTERTSAQKLIEQQRAHIVTASKFSALGEMAGNVAHEINTPLAIIQLLSDKMTAQIESEGIVPADLIQTAETISNTVTRIAKIIAGMRSLSRTTDQDAMVETKIASIIGDTLALCSEKFKNHGVRLSVNCSTDALVECRGVQIAQVLLNILNNAYDAIEDQEQKWVELQVEDLDSFVRVRITDSGLRMSAEVQRKVFLPFFTTKELGRGTGIGLSVSQSIIDSHGGSLLIDPHSITTSFVIDLPKKHANSKGSSGSRLKIAG